MSRKGGDGGGGGGSGIEFEQYDQVPDENFESDGYPGGARHNVVFTTGTKAGFVFFAALVAVALIVCIIGASFIFYDQDKIEDIGEGVDAIKKIVSNMTSSTELNFVVLNSSLTVNSAWVDYLNIFTTTRRNQQQQRQTGPPSDNSLGNVFLQFIIQYTADMAELRAANQALQNQLSTLQQCCTNVSDMVSNNYDTTIQLVQNVNETISESISELNTDVDESFSSQTDLIETSTSILTTQLLSLDSLLSDVALNLTTMLTAHDVDVKSEFSLLDNNLDLAFGSQTTLITDESLDIQNLIANMTGTCVELASAQLAAMDLAFGNLDTSLDNSFTSLGASVVSEASDISIYVGQVNSSLSSQLEGMLVTLEADLSAMEVDTGNALDIVGGYVLDVGTAVADLRANDTARSAVTDALIISSSALVIGNLSADIDGVSTLLTGTLTDLETNLDSFFNQTVTTSEAVLLSAITGTNATCSDGTGAVLASLLTTKDELIIFVNQTCP